MYFKILLGRIQLNLGSKTMQKRVKRNTAASAVQQTRKQMDEFLYDRPVQVLLISNKSNIYVVPASTITHRTSTVSSLSQPE